MSEEFLQDQVDLLNAENALLAAKIRKIEKYVAVLSELETARVNDRPADPLVGGDAGELTNALVRAKAMYEECRKHFFEKYPDQS